MAMITTNPKENQIPGKVVVGPNNPNKLTDNDLTTISNLSENQCRVKFFLLWGRRVYDMLARVILCFL